MRIVHKYGGTSLGDDARVENAARHVAALAKEGHRMIVVVSAQGDTTDALLADAARANPREKDAYIAVGELLSAGKLVMALEKAGCPAVSLAGWELGNLHVTPKPKVGAGIQTSRSPCISQGAMCMKHTQIRIWFRLLV